MTDDLRAANRDLSSLQIHRDDDRPRSGKAVWAILFVILMGIGGYFVWRKLSGAGRLPVVETGMVRRVGAGEGSAFLSAAGYILAETKSDVSSKAFGRLAWIGVAENSIVKKDEVIAKLENDDLAAQVEEAKAQLADADREYKRWKKIVEDGVEPREKLDRAETNLQLAKARLKRVEADFEYTLIRAPFDGVVVKKPAHVGETVGPAGGTGTGSTGGSVCTIIDRSSLEMVADVNESNIAKVKVGQQVEIAIDALPERKYRGEVRLVVPTADRQKGIVQVKVRILDLDDAIRPEYSARATFLREGGAAAGTKRLMAPRGAVRERGGQKGVFLLEGARVRWVAVETGLEGEDGVEILKGLTGGELAVVGGDAVEDGAEVQSSEKK